MGECSLLPITDEFNKRFSLANKSKKVFKTKRREQLKREAVLDQLIPFPENIDLTQLRKFKDKHREILNAFKNKVESIALNPNLDEASPLFRETIKELEYSKSELSAKMGESKLGSIFFGTICGIVSSTIGLATAGTNGAIIAGVTSLAGAIYSASQNLRDENITNQNGMKYLALVDKKLRKA